MMGHFGFSWIGLLFLLMLMIPNLIWMKHQPQGYSAAAENRRLGLCERIGEALTSTFALIFSDFNLRPWSARSWWLIAAFAAMILYEYWWFRYFHSEQRLADFYCDLWGIPVAGATLPVIAFILLGIYGRVFVMVIAAVILGIGHIGIHWQHQKALER